MALTLALFDLTNNHRDAKLVRHKLDGLPIESFFERMPGRRANLVVLDTQC
jgi:hypothetical protein